MLLPLMLSSLIGLTSVPPVDLAACAVSTPVTIERAGDAAPEPYGGYALHVRFSNVSKQPISRVTFALTDGTKVSDAGTFSPGVAISHALVLKDTDAASCSVSAVEFADGTTWVATHNIALK